jgi:hypothetical protein
MSEGLSDRLGESRNGKILERRVCQPLVLPVPSVIRETDYKGDRSKGYLLDRAGDRQAMRMHQDEKISITRAGRQGSFIKSFLLDSINFNHNVC